MDLGSKIKGKWVQRGNFWSLVFLPVLQAFFYMFLDLFVSMSVLRRCCFGCRTLCFLVCFWYGRFAGMLWKSSKPTSNTSEKSMENRWKNKPKKSYKMSFSWISVGTANRTHFLWIWDRFGYGFWELWGTKMQKLSIKKRGQTMIRFQLHSGCLLGSYALAV